MSPTAMILFSIIEFFANGWCGAQWRSFIRWRIFWLYCRGGAVSFSALRVIELFSTRSLVDLLLEDHAVRRRDITADHRLATEHRRRGGMPFITGVLTTIVQFMAGVQASSSTCSFKRARSTR